MPYTNAKPNTSLALKSDADMVTSLDKKQKRRNRERKERNISEIKYFFLVK